MACQANNRVLLRSHSSLAQRLSFAIREDLIWKPQSEPLTYSDILALLKEIHFKFNFALAQLKTPLLELLETTYFELYLLYHGFKDFSARFDPLKVMTYQQLHTIFESSLANELRTLIMTAVPVVEQISSFLLSQDLLVHDHENSSEARVIKIIRYLAGLETHRPYSALDKETLLQIYEELLYGQIDEDSVVLVVGCGPLPITAAAYALHCRKVYLVDISQEALNAAQSFLALCPRWMRDKCECVCADALTFDWNAFETSHLLLAGMLPVKQRVLQNLLNDHTRAHSLRCIIRDPKMNLMTLFNYPIGDFAEELGESAIRYNTRAGSWADIIVTDLPRAV